MQLILNELSFLPLADTPNVLEERFEIFFKCFEKAKTKFRFNHISFPQGYDTIPATAEFTFQQWVLSLENRQIKQAILTFFRKPFLDDLNEIEASNYYRSEYRITEPDVPTLQEPIGLVVAAIKELPAISIEGHDFWRRSKINIYRAIDNEVQQDFIQAYNVCLETSFDLEDLATWSNECYSKNISDADKLSLYLDFSKFSVSFNDDFLQQIFEWKNTDFETYKYVLKLMKDVETNPFSGGMGQTENLLNRGKEASKRVNGTDRLSYTVEKGHCTFIACKGHYKFH